MDPAIQNPQKGWTEVDKYFSNELIPHDPLFEEVLAANAREGLPPYDISPNQGKLLQIFAKMINARSILEVGTLGGYSTIWLARALQKSGKLITIEIDMKHAAVAKENFKRAGLQELIDLRIGDAIEVLDRLIKEESATFDFIFIDADKKNNPTYFKRALKLSHPGTIIVVDNVVRNGTVIDQTSADPSIVGVRQLNELIKSEAGVESTVVQTVGIKGHDGFIISRVC